jgi:AcrR family transcriptional regulator
MARSDAARTALLDAAERLFAEGGIATVSDRRVAEVAGNTNHSAVRYYFGGRDGLLRALIARHLLSLEEPRRALFEASDSLLDDVRSLVVPGTAALDALPRPSRRARFIAQALHDPAAARVFREVGAGAPTAERILLSVVARLDHLVPAVVRGRASLMTLIVAEACAGVEARAEESGDDPHWPAVGDFLADAITGMLLAPISQTPGQASLIDTGAPAVV